MQIVSEDHFSHLALSAREFPLTLAWLEAAFGSYSKTTSRNDRDVTKTTKIRIEFFDTWLALTHRHQVVL